MKHGIQEGIHSISTSSLWRNGMRIENLKVKTPIASYLWKNSHLPHSLSCYSRIDLTILHILNIHVILQVLCWPIVYLVMSHEILVQIETFCSVSQRGVMDLRSDGQTGWHKTLPFSFSFDGNGRQKSAYWRIPISTIDRDSEPRL